MGIVTAPAVFKAVWLGVTTSLIAKGLSGKPKSKALETGKPNTLAQRGDQLPVLIGRAKLAPMHAWEGPHTFTFEGSGTGGKGIGTGAGAAPNQVFFADGVHFLCVGPAWRLRSIKENGEVIWPLPGQLPNGITRTSHPSGSTLGTTVPTGGIANHGNFTIYWGDDPPVTTPATTHWTAYRQATGVQSDWPFCCGVYWHDKRLGGSEVWGLLEYDMECEPYSTLVNSNGWVDNGSALSTNAADTKLVLRYVPPVVGVEPRSQLWIAGNHTGAGTGFTNLFPTGVLFDLRDTGAGLDGTYVSDESVWDPTTQVTIPNTAYDQLEIPWNAAAWLTSNCTIAVATTPTLPPGYVPGWGGDHEIWRITRTASNHTYSCGEKINGNPDNPDPNDGDDGDDIGTDVSSLTLYVDLATFPQGLAGDGIWFGFRSATLADIATNEVAWAVIRRSGGTFTASVGVESNAYANTVPAAFWIASFTQFGGGSTWWRLTVNFKCPLGGLLNFSEDSKLAWILRVNQQAFIGSTGAPPTNFLVIDDTYNALNGAWVSLARRVPIATPVTGVTRIYTAESMAGGVAFHGRVTPFIPDPNGTAGANPAHIIDQLLFATDPHGLGMDPGPWDRDTLETLGVDYEEVRAHALVEQRQVVKQSISDLCTDVGIAIRWNPITGKVEFKKRREEAPFAVIPRETLVENLVSRVRKLESDPARSFVFTWQQAQDNYSKASLEIDDLGNILSTARAGAEIINIPSVRDLSMARILASYRAAYELSRGSVIVMSLKNDAATLMPDDVVDVEALTDIDVPFRLITTSRQPLSSVVKVSGFFDHMNVEDAFVLELNGPGMFPPGTPDKPDPDYAVASFQQPDGTYLFLRIPSHADALHAILMVSTDATSYWSVGVVPACVGGPILEDYGTTASSIEDGFYFQQPTGKFAEALPQLPAGSVVEGVLRLITEEREIIYFRELESFGDNVWRVKGMLRAQQSTVQAAMVAGQNIWIWLNDTMPSFDANLPTTGTPSFKLVPYTHRRISDVPAVADAPIMP